ncbi:30305_t:CDS:10 [Racocetra persica]|uniref:30305_t:CDS:1 n=1 Tax=Racocetra persica TaxID=160502 RepID=A0ACA9KP01_9GLOM|nr:30305_t:CDS:10 [Racocetra persica]
MVAMVAMLGTKHTKHNQGKGCRLSLGAKAGGETYPRLRVISGQGVIKNKGVNSSSTPARDIYPLTIRWITITLHLTFPYPSSEECKRRITCGAGEGITKGEGVGIHSMTKPGLFPTRIPRTNHLGIPLNFKGRSLVKSPPWRRYLVSESLLKSSPLKLMNCTRDKTQIRVSYPTLSLDFFIQVALDKAHRGDGLNKLVKEEAHQGLPPSWLNKEGGRFLRDWIPGYFPPPLLLVPDNKAFPRFLRFSNNLGAISPSTIEVTFYVPSSLTQESGLGLSFDQRGPTPLLITREMHLTKLRNT